MVFDSKGDLFVSNQSTNTITEFAAGLTPGTFGKVTSFTDPSLDEPAFLAFGPSAPVPEASSVVSFGLLLLLGLGGLIVARRKGLRA